MLKEDSSRCPGVTKVLRGMLSTCGVVIPPALRRSQEDPAWSHLAVSATDATCMLFWGGGGENWVEGVAELRRGLRSTWVFLRCHDCLPHLPPPMAPSLGLWQQDFGAQRLKSTETLFQVLQLCV